MIVEYFEMSKLSLIVKFTFCELGDRRWNNPKR